MEQPRFERVLRLMKLMSGNNYYTIDELADKLETSYRSIYRYIDTFKTVGFAVEKVDNNVYRLMNLPSEYKNLKNLVYFSQEEGQLLCNMIESLDSTNTMKAEMYRKLARIYDVSKIDEFEGSKSNLTTIENLRSAMEDGKKVILRSYSSSNSGIIRDRLVEPFAFTNNHIEVWAYDLQAKVNKIFKVPRIKSVDTLSELWTEEDKHRISPIDAFHMCGEKTIPVRIEMSLLAKNLLDEEFPLARPGISECGDHWAWEGQVCKLAGIGRFVMGLSTEIYSIDCPKLVAYLKESFKGSALRRIMEEQ